MIEKSDSIISMLKNVKDKTNAVLINIEEDNKVHFSYMLEKLNSAFCDLEVLIGIAENKLKEENKRLGIEEEND